MPVHIRNRRHNVEASIFQLSYRYNMPGKTRYRRLLPHQSLGMVSQFMDQSGKDQELSRPAK